MAEIGFYLLYIGLGVAALSVASSLMGVFTHSPSLIRVGERGSLALLAIVTLTMILLARLFLMDDFAVQYVAEHSSRSTPTLYKFTALWGGQSGSLLLWVWIQSIYTAAVVLTNRRKNRDLMPYANAVLSGITAFFLVTLCFASNPFLRLAAVPLDGAGLNPLLQNPMMAIHPPTLYVGYIGFSVPSRLPWPLLPRVVRETPGFVPADAGPCSPGSFWARAFSWAHGGPTWSWAGGGTGPGIRWRMHPSCPG